MQAKVSIVIPVYNAEKYLNRCLDSIVNQTYTNLEIILINDGSKDNSLKICNKYKENDYRFKIITKENGGVSSARNLGIKESTGDVLTFIDSDDWIESDYIEKSIKFFCKYNCDLLKTNYSVIEKNEEYIRYKYNDNFCKISTKRMKEILCTEGMFNCVWATFYKTSILKNEKIEFDKKIIFGEDLMFQINNYKYFKNIYWINNPGYFYFNIGVGASRNKDMKHLIKVSSDIFKVYKYLYSLCQNKKILCDTMFRLINNNLKCIINQNPIKYKEFKNITSLIFDFKFNEIKFKDIKNLKNENSFNKILLYFLIKQKWLLYYMILKLKKVVRRK